MFFVNVAYKCFPKLQQKVNWLEIWYGLSIGPADTVQKIKFSINDFFSKSDGGF